MKVQALVLLIMAAPALMANAQRPLPGHRSRQLQTRRVHRAVGSRPQIQHAQQQQQPGYRVQQMQKRPVYAWADEDERDGWARTARVSEPDETESKGESSEKEEAKDEGEKNVEKEESESKDEGDSKHHHKHHTEVKEKEHEHVAPTAPLVHGTIKNDTAPIVSTPAPVPELLVANQTIAKPIVGPPFVPTATLVPVMNTTALFPPVKTFKPDPHADPHNIRRIAIELEKLQNDPATSHLAKYCVSHEDCDGYTTMLVIKHKGHCLPIDQFSLNGTALADRLLTPAEIAAGKGNCWSKDPAEIEPYEPVFI